MWARNARTRAVAPLIKSRLTLSARCPPFAHAFPLLICQRTVLYGLKNRTIFIIQS